MVEITKLSFSYGSCEENIFSSFSLKIDAGQILLLNAPAGSGKTTLARILTGGVPKYSGGVISGKVSIDNNDILALDTSERIAFVGRVPQNTDEMILFSTVESELSFPLENLGLGEVEIEKKVSHALALFELDGYRKVSTTELSGGEKRRLMCAILFMINPSLYVFDESFDELSDRWRKKLCTLIKESGKSVLILASHPLSVYDGLYDRVISINNGEVVDYNPDVDISSSLKAYFRDSLYKKNNNQGSLEAKDIRLFRPHRSILEENPFALDIENFSIKKGSLQLLMGDNGAGKSTLSKVLCGLLKEKSGSVLIAGHKVGEKERRTRVAYLMQNPFEQLFLPTVYDELKSTEAIDDDIEKALSLFKLDKNMYISEISYGKAKLVQAAIFYLLDRDYVIFDELDSAIGYNDSLSVVKAYLEKGSGVLVITHDEYFASLLNCERSYIKDGKICK